jgi:hypothetical protein
LLLIHDVPKVLALKMGKAKSEQHAVPKESVDYLLDAL